MNIKTYDKKVDRIVNTIDAILGLIVWLLVWCICGSICGFLIESVLWVSDVHAAFLWRTALFLWSPPFTILFIIIGTARASCHYLGEEYGKDYNKLRYFWMLCAARVEISSDKKQEAESWANENINCLWFCGYNSHSHNPDFLILKRKEALLFKLKFGGDTGT